MIQVFQKMYENKFMTEVTYYVFLQSYGAKPYFQVVHESISDYTHYLSRYTVYLNFHLQHKDKIEVEILKYSPNVVNKIKSKRKLAVLTKFVFHLILENNDINITKSLNRVEYHNNGQDIILSPKAFLVSYYRLIPIFEQILQESKTI